MQHAYLASSSFLCRTHNILTSNCTQAIEHTVQRAESSNEHHWDNMRNNDDTINTHIQSAQYMV